MTQMLGRAQITVDGEVYETKPGASMDLGGTSRAAQIYGTTVGYAEATAMSTVRGEIALRRGQSLETLRNARDIPVSFLCDTGQSYVVNGAWLATPLVVTDGEGGSIPIELQGPPAEEIA